MPRIRPTRHAVVFFFILGAMFLASINYQSNAAWLMVFLIFTTGCMSAVHGLRNVGPAQLAAGDPPLVQAGDRARVTVTVSCRAGRDLYALVVELPPEHAPPDAGDLHRLLVPYVQGRGSSRAELLLPPFARGIHVLDTLLISTQYPLGLFRVVRRVPVRVVLDVYPEPLGVALSQARPDPDAEEGTGSGASIREHEDFRGLRAWQTGDSPRHVDWKAAARGNGTLLVKEYAGGGAGITWLTWSATSGQDEARLSQLAKWVVEAHYQALCYGLRLPGCDIEPDTGAPHYQRCLRALAACTPQGASGRRVAPPAVSGPRLGSTASVSGTGTGLHRIPTDRHARGEAAKVATDRHPRSEPRP